MSSINQYPPGYETWSEKFGRKVRENPWVPAGCLATTGALIMSAHKMRKGESTQMNYWMRARVGLQGLTLVALVAGTLALRSEREATQAALEAKTLAETGMNVEQLKVQKEKEEFEARLRGAEAATEEEKGLLRSVVKGPTVVRHEKAAAPAPAVAEVQASAVPSPSVEEKTAKKSWWKVW